MKKLFSMFAVLGAMFAFTACSNGPDEGPTPVNPAEKGQEIVISARMADYTRATDTAFEEGDEVGLFVLLSEEHLSADANMIKAYVNNAPFKADAEGNLKNGDVNMDGQEDDQDKLYWYTADYTSTLVGYYPLQEAWDYTFLEDMEFTVNADQSTHALYTASDLMMAVATAAPSESAVALPFKHMLSKMVVKVDNRSGEEIANVWLSNVLGSVTFNLENPTALTAQGSKGTIKMAPATNADNEAQWVAIVAPQADAAPELIVTTASEKQYTYTLPETLSFVQGKQVTATVVLSEQNISTAFTPTISDWTDDNDLNFKKEDSGEEGGEDDPVVDVPAEENWGVVGDFNGWGTAEDGSATDAKMTYNEGIYTVEQVLYRGQAFKLRKDAAWEVNRGSAAVDAEGYLVRSFGDKNGEFAVCADGADIFVSESAIYVITWNAINETMTVEAKAGATVTDTWGLVGSFAASGWETDIDMTWTAESVADMHYSVEVELTAGDEFKFRQNDDWVFDYGGSELPATLELDKNYPLSVGGANIVAPATGTYTVYFYHNWQSPTFKLVCETPNPETPVAGERSEWGIVGVFNSWNAPDVALYTTSTSGLLVAEDVTLEAYSEFKFRTNETWGTELTSNVSGVKPNSWVVAGAGSNNTSVSVAGTYDIYLDTVNNRIYVMEPDADYTTATQQTESVIPEMTTDGIKIYARSLAGWSSMYLYGWEIAGTTFSWPGLEMGKETVDGVEYFVYQLPADATDTTGNIIFNNGSGSQTVDITNVTFSGDLFFEVSASAGADGKYTATQLAN